MYWGLTPILNSNGKGPTELTLGSERYTYLRFHYLRCALLEMKAEDYWVDFIDIYSALADNEMEQYQQQYPQETNTLASLSDRLRAEGMEQGMPRGVEDTLRKQIQLNFGQIPTWADKRLSAATNEQLDQWVIQILFAEQFEDLFNGDAPHKD